MTNLPSNRNDDQSNTQNSYLRKNIRYGVGVEICIYLVVFLGCVVLRCATVPARWSDYVLSGTYVALS